MIPGLVGNVAVIVVPNLAQTGAAHTRWPDRNHVASPAITLWAWAEMPVLPGGTGFMSCNDMVALDEGGATEIGLGESVQMFAETAAVRVLKIDYFGAIVIDGLAFGNPVRAITTAHDINSPELVFAETLFLVLQPV